LHYDVLLSLHSSRYVYGVISSRRVKWTVIGRIELRVKFWSENSLVELGPLWRILLKLCALYLSGLEEGPMVWSCEYG